uniref:ionotropic receptor 156 precursor n=1 Tax=Aedes aegypti TaxID=7159 RepID=UPI000C21023E|nr:ionotropic receptor 156 precursor [Aedes aegypti]
MHISWFVSLLLLTDGGNTCNQLTRNVEFLHRIIMEGLTVDQTTTDLLFMNFKQQEFIDLLDALLERLRQSTLFSAFINARSRHGRTRQIIVVAAPDHPMLKAHYFEYFSRLSIPADEQLENSPNKHVIVVTTNVNYLYKIFTATLDCFKTFNFIVLVYSELTGHIFTLDRNRYINPADWSSPFNTVLANRLYEPHPNPIILGAIVKRPWIEMNEGRLSGLDITVFKTILNHIGQSYKFIIIETGNVTATADAIDAMFLKGEISAYVNRIGFLSEWTVEMWIPHTDGLCLMVPKTQSRYLFQHLLQPYEFTSWILFCSFLLVIGVVSSLWRRMFHQNLILTLFCGSSYSHHRMRRVERFLVVGSSCLLTILFEAYLVKFITHMTTYRYVRDPTTIDEYLKTPGKLLVHELVVNGTLKARTDLAHKLVVTPSMVYDIGNLTYGYMLRCSSAKSMLSLKAERDRQTFGYNVRPQFHVIPEKLEVTHSRYTFGTKVLCYAHFKRYLSWLFDSGLMNYWEKGVEQKYFFPPGYMFKESAVLDLESLQLVWVVYGIGIAISSVVLLLELILGAIVSWLAAYIVLRSVAF